jgi:hypothetical protein
MFDLSEGQMHAEHALVFSQLPQPSTYTASIPVKLEPQDCQVQICPNCSQGVDVSAAGNYHSHVSHCFVQTALSPTIESIEDSFAMPGQADKTTRKKITRIRRRAGKMPLSQRISLMESLDRLARCEGYEKPATTPRAQEQENFAIGMLYGQAQEAEVSLEQEQLTRKKQRLHSEMEVLKVALQSDASLHQSYGELGSQQPTMHLPPFYQQPFTPSALHAPSFHPNSLLFSPHSFTPPPSAHLQNRPSSGKRHREALFTQEWDFSAKPTFDMHSELDHIMPPSLWNAVQV